LRTAITLAGGVVTPHSPVTAEWLAGKRAWTLDLPHMDYSTPNSREHWAQKARKAREWRNATALLARQAKIPTCERITVSLELWPFDKRRRDPDNLLLVLKHCIDGLRDANVIADDTGDQVSFSTPVIHPPRPDRFVKWRLTVEAS
jgi:crossover junction endodeoxyribonuclease RusA